MEISKLNHFLRPLVLISNGDGNGYGDEKGKKEKYKDGRYKF